MKSKMLILGHTIKTEEGHKFIINVDEGDIIIPLGGIQCIFIYKYVLSVQNLIAFNAQIQFTHKRMTILCHSFNIIEVEEKNINFWYIFIYIYQ